MMTTLGIVVIVGLVFGKLAQLVKLPSVTGYLIGGIMVGPAVLGLIQYSDITNMRIISEMALALIAFSIGAEFNVKHLKQIGKGIMIITVCQALVTVAAVFVIMRYVFSQSLAFSLLLAAISAATAPAATVVVIRQYKANGPLVQTLLPVVAIDDAICILIFGVAFSVAKAVIGSASPSFLLMVEEPIIEIAGSLLLGLVGGLIFGLNHKRFSSNDESLAAVLGIVFICMGLAVRYNLSTLLTCMMVGATIANLLPDSKRIFVLTENVTPPIYLMFFTLAGAGLHLSELSHIGMTGIAYILARTAGKLMGAALGAQIAHAPKVILKYLGLGLLPQAGVAIGLATLANQSFPSFGSTLTTIVLGGVVVFELLGPMLAKLALEKAGEMGAQQKRMTSQHFHAH